MHHTTKYLDRADRKCLYAPGKMIQLRVSELVWITFFQKEIRNNSGSRLQLTVAMSSYNRQIAGLEEFCEVVFVDRFDIDTLFELFEALAKELQGTIYRSLSRGRDVVTDQTRYCTSDIRYKR